MKIHDLELSLSKVAQNLGYFKQIIFGYEDQLSTGKTNDPNNSIATFPILLMPPLHSELNSRNEEKFTPFSLMGNKRPKSQHNVAIEIFTSNLVKFTATAFIVGDVVNFTDPRTNKIYIIQVGSINAGVATCTSYIDIAVGNITVNLKEHTSKIHNDLLVGITAILSQLAVETITTLGTKDRITSFSKDLKIYRYDRQSVRGFIQTVVETEVKITNCGIW